MKQLGKRSQLFGGLETSFKTPPSLTGSHFLRHVSAQFNHDSKNRVFSPEKKAGPGRYARFDRRETADWSAEVLLRPSGTLNTLPEASFILEGGFGQKTNITLSATVSTGTGTVGGATLDSVTGLVAGTTAVQIACPDGKLRLRPVTGVSGTDVTWAPDLPSGQAPADGAAVKGVICYSLTAALAKSIFLARYNFEADYTAGLAEIIKGGGVDRLSISGDYQNEFRISASGPAALRTDAPSHPGSTTQVGTNPLTAMSAECLVGGVAMNYLKLQFELTNGLTLRNDELDATNATELYRGGDRDISVGFDVAMENEDKATLYDKALAGTNASLFKQVGLTTSGKLVALYAPRVEWKPPTVDAGDGDVMLPFKGLALESVEDANDELVLILG